MSKGGHTRAATDLDLIPDLDEGLQCVVQDTKQEVAHLVKVYLDFGYLETGCQLLNGGRQREGALLDQLHRLPTDYPDLPQEFADRDANLVERDDRTKDIQCHLLDLLAADGYPVNLLQLLQDDAWQLLEEATEVLEGILDVLSKLLYITDDTLQSANRLLERVLDALDLCMWLPGRRRRHHDQII